MTVKRSNLIKPINVEGGTFYTFQSAIEDFDVSKNDSTKKVEFSNYALLNIPKILTPVLKENSLQFDAIDGSFLDITGNNNIDLAESLQNYCFNLETTITSQLDYDVNNSLSVSERVFFKWLKELGGIRYRNANLTESILSTNTFTEEDTSLLGNQRYNRVVEHIGIIDVKNSIKDINNSYSEIFIRLGAMEGNTNTILFKTVSDNNYSPNKVFRNLTDNPLNKEVLVGREYDDIHPVGLSLQSFYDNDGVTQKTLNGIIGENWYGTTTERNVFFSEPITFESALNDEIKLEGLGTSSKSVDVFRSRLDGVMIDFEPENYKYINDSNTVNTIPEMNVLGTSKSFEFNAILIYYDVFDGVETFKNLYGVLFLDDVKSLSAGGGKINTFQKIKANKLVSSNGNSFGLKINLKSDSSIENVGVEISVSEDANVSMEMFMDAISRLYQTIEIFDNQNNILLDYNEKILALENLVISNQTLQTLIPRINILEQTINNLDVLKTNSDEIKNLINSLNDSFIGILNNNTSINVSYNLDVIKAGLGIQIDRNVQDIIRINNTQQNYTISDSIIDLSSSLIFTYNLQEHTNYLRHENVNGLITFNDNIIFNINENNIKWVKGQTLRFSIATPLDFDGFVLKIVLNDINLTEIYQVILNTTDFINRDTKIIDIICIDAINQVFVVDYIN